MERKDWVLGWVFFRREMVQRLNLRLVWKAPRANPREWVLMGQAIWELIYRHDCKIYKPDHTAGLLPHLLLLEFWPRGRVRSSSSFAEANNGRNFPHLSSPLAPHFVRFKVMFLPISFIFFVMSFWRTRYYIIIILNFTFINICILRVNTEQGTNLSLHL